MYVKDDSYKASFILATYTLMHTHSHRVESKTEKQCGVTQSISAPLSFFSMTCIFFVLLSKLLKCY